MDWGRHLMDKDIDHDGHGGHGGHWSWCRNICNRLEISLSTSPYFVWSSQLKLLYTERRSSPSPQLGVRHFGLGLLPETRIIWICSQDLELGETLAAPRVVSWNLSFIESLRRWKTFFGSSTFATPSTTIIHYIHYLLSLNLRNSWFISIIRASCSNPRPFLGTWQWLKRWQSEHLKGLLLKKRYWKPVHNRCASLIYILW